VSLEQTYTSAVIVYQGPKKLAAQKPEQKALQKKIEPLKQALDQAMDDKSYALSPEFKTLALTKPGTSDVAKTNLDWAGEEGAAIKKHAENLQKIQF
jgi:hypothetical protein